MESPLLDPAWWSVLAVLNRTAARAARTLQTPGGERMAADFERASIVAGAIAQARQRRQEKAR